MKIGLQTWGSDGDIRPFIALAGGLVRAGHNVTLAVTSVDCKEYANFAAALGFTLREVAYTPYRREDIPRLTHEIRSTRLPLLQLRTILRIFFDPLADQMYDAAQLLCAENDAVIGHFLVHPLQAAAQLAKRPHGTVILNHSSIPSRHLTPFGVPRLGAWLNPAWWRIGNFLMDRTLLPAVNKFRTRHALPPISRNLMGDLWSSAGLNLIAVSSAFCPSQPDWPSQHLVCGSFDLHEPSGHWHQPPGLHQFIASGPAPIYLTFGSWMELEEDPTAIANLMIQAVKQAGCRALIQGRWTEVTSLAADPDIHRIETAPHHLLFPQCALIVHHGGAGTTHSACRAGLPSIVVEHFGDQPFWAAELHRLGIAGNTLHRRSLTAGRLAAAIRKTLADSAMQERARQIGSRIRQEDGVHKAVAAIEHHLLHQQPKT